MKRIAYKRKTIWEYAIFGNISEIIHIIEETCIMQKKKSFNDIANYLIEDSIVSKKH